MWRGDHRPPRILFSRRRRSIHLRNFNKSSHFSRSRLKELFEEFVENHESYVADRQERGLLFVLV